MVAQASAGAVSAARRPASAWRAWIAAFAPVLASPRRASALGFGDTSPAASCTNNATNSGRPSPVRITARSTSAAASPLLSAWTRSSPGWTLVPWTPNQLTRPSTRPSRSSMRRQVLRRWVARTGSRLALRGASRLRANAESERLNATGSLAGISTAATRSRPGSARSSASRIAATTPSTTASNTHAEIPPLVAA